MNTKKEGLNSPAPPSKVSKIKVAHVVHDMGSGGVTESIYQLAKALPSDNYELFLYSLKNNLADYPDQEMRVERFSNIGVNVMFLECYWKKTLNVGEMSDWILRNQIEILHTHSYQPNIFGRIAGMLCKVIKVVAHYHNFYDDKWEKDQSLIFDKLLVAYTDRIITCSEAVRKHVLSKMDIPSDKIEVILNGVDSDRYAVHMDGTDVKIELGIPKNHKIVGVVGRISEVKAQDDFIRAAKLIKKAIPETTFLIVGDGDDDGFLEKLKKMANKLDLEKSIIFTGFRGDMPKIYNLLDVLVMPTKSEGLPGVLLEAMTCGKPVVATKLEPITEVVIPDETALLVPVSSPDDIAINVIALLKDPDRARRFGEKGKELSKSYSWKRAGKRLDAIYKDLVGHREIKL